MTDRRSATLTKVSAGVDWISGTLGREELDDQSWMSDCLYALSDIQALGNTYKRRSLLGFDGWECAGCFVGSNDTMHYAQFAGKYAHDAYKYLEHPKVHISRIDLQVTVQYDIELLKEGKYQYARAIHHNKALPEHRRRTINLFAGSDGGDTVYVGSPSSDQRGRIYNKQRQSLDNAYKHSWRYEAVYRNTYASSVFRRIIATSDALDTIIVPTVVEFFRERGLSILGLGDRSGNVIEMERTPPSDVDRKLRWIKNQVIPTIRKLAELGYAEELMETIAEAISAARSSQNQS